jgi:hypothetical protein
MDSHSTSKNCRGQVLLQGQLACVTLSIVNAVLVPLRATPRAARPCDDVARHMGAATMTCHGGTSMGNGLWRRVAGALQEELRQQMRVQPSSRSWEMPMAAAIASGSPLLAGTAFGRMDLGLAAMLGGLVFLNLPDTGMRHRMAVVGAISVAMVACYTLGALTHFVPPLMVLTLALLSTVASMAARFFRLAPPGILFVMMAAAIAAYSPMPLRDIPLRIALVAAAALFASAVACLYSVYRLRRGPPPAQAPVRAMDFDYVVVDSVIIGACVGLSLATAELLQLERPYWAPVSCLAVIQGASLRMIWNRHAQRVLGTVAGLALTWTLLAAPLDHWGVALVMIALSFVIEILVVRHYGLAVIFITPLTILLAEAAQLGQHSPLATMQARVLDIAVGSAFGLAGGAVLHITAVRSRVARAIRAVLPRRR